MPIVRGLDYYCAELGAQVESSFLELINSMPDLTGLRSACLLLIGQRVRKKRAVDRHRARPNASKYSIPDTFSVIFHDYS